MKSENYCDIQTLKECLAGNTQAFEAMVGKYQALICAVTYSATGKTDVSEDLAQETFIQAWKNLGQLEDLNKFRSWLLSIAKRCILNYFRKNRQAGATADADLIADQPANCANPAEEAVSKEEATIVGEAMMRLPKNYRVPMVLYYRQQHSISQVATIMGQAESTVRVHLHRGRQMLKEHVESMIDRTLSKTAPTKAFTGVVIAAIVGATVSKSATAGVSQAAGGTSGGTLGTLIGSTTAKITAAAAAAVIITASAVLVYMNQSDANARTTEPITQSLSEQDKSTVPTPEVNPATTEPATLSQTPAKIPEPVKPATVAPPVVKPPAVVEVESDKTQPRVEHMQEEGYTFQAKGVLSGLITDIETGQPVTDAEVTISPGRLYRAKTDENGFYSFDKIDKNGNYDVAVYSTEYIGTGNDKRPKIHLTQNGAAVQDFQLEKACMIDMYVMDTDGKPIKGVQLWTTSLGDEYGLKEGRSYVSQHTNAEGYLRLGGFAPSSFQYQINAMHARTGKKWITKNGGKYKPSFSDYAPGYLRIALDNPNLIEYGEIVLQKGTSIKGIAKYADGTPASECKIVATPEWWHSTTSPPQFEIDPNGMFTLEQIVPGSYHVEAHVPNGPSTWRGCRLFTRQLLPENGLLEITIPQKPRNDDANTRENATKPKICGMVVDAETQQSISDFQIRVIKLRGSNYIQSAEWTRFKDNQGAFEMDVVAEAVYRVQAVADGYAAAWSDEINTTHNTEVRVKLSRGGSVSGRVVDSNGRPVVDATVLPGVTASNIKASGERVFESEVGAVVTDKMGRFDLQHLPEGTECLKVTHPDFAYTLVSDIKVKSGREHRIGKIVLNAGGTVKGVYFDISGKPQPGVTLYAQNHYGYSTSEVKHATAVTEPNGFYRFEHLPEEMMYIVRPRSYEQTGVVSCGLIPQNETVTTMNIGGGSIIQGQLTINGKPLANTRMLLEKGQWCSRGLYRCHGDTDANGNFSLASGGPGLYTLSYSRRGKYSSVTTKLLDIKVDTKDISLGTIPTTGKTLRIQFDTTNQQENELQYFFLRDEDPFNGPCVFWQDDPKAADMPYEVDGLKAGRYYVTIRQKAGCEYRHMIEITETDDILDVTIPIFKGSVTVVGTLPEGISHAYLINEAQTVSSILFNRKDDGFRIENLPPGRYQLCPLWLTSDNAATIEIPDQTEFKLEYDHQQLFDLLKKRVMIRVFDENGQPTSNTTVWIENDGRIIHPAYQGNYSSLFYLSGGEHIIHAEKGTLKTVKPYKLMLDKKNNTGSGELVETFIQLKSVQ